MPALDAVASEVCAWFEAYRDIFQGLEAGERVDLEVLLGFYGVPLVVVADARYAALTDRAAVLGFAQAMVDQLRRMDYADSTFHRLDVHPLNARAALIEGAFVLHDRKGAELERRGAAYLATKTDDGWRIASLMLTAP